MNADLPLEPADAAADTDAAPVAAAGVQRHLVSGSSLDEAAALYGQLHHAHRVELTPRHDEPFAYRLRAVGDERMLLRSSTLSAQRWGRIEPQGRYLLTWAQRGSAVFDAATALEHVLLPGVPAMYPTGRPFSFEAAPGTVLHTVDLDADYLRRLRGPVEDESAPLAFTRNLDDSSLARLQAGLAAATPDLLGPATSAARRRELTDTIGRLVLEAFLVTDLRAPEQYAGAVGRALEFIEAHCTEVVTLVDIASAARVSPRGLQHAFARSDLPTPMTVLRQTRLRRAREALLSSDPRRASIADVARSWQFSHLGRFASHYSAEFGELPSETRQR